MKIVGIDFGLRRIGVAVGDTSLKMAFARPSIDVRKGSALETVVSILRSEDAELVVIGLPLLESGNEGEQAVLTREFGETLAGEGFKVVYWDERYTTAEANRRLAHLKSPERKSLEDSEAARIMLEEYMESDA
jgi:putative Holliday junction resolvase